MNSKKLNILLEQLTNAEKIELFNKLKKAVLGDTSHSKEVYTCPCCNETHFVKRGSYKGIQKYICKKTSKIFTYRSMLAISGVAKLNKMVQLLDFMIVEQRFLTIEEIQQKLLVSKQTAQDWRTKILTAIYEEVDFNDQVIEFDETFFRLSMKGRNGLGFGRKRGKKLVGDNKYNVKVFMVYSRTTKKLELRVSHIGKTSSQDLENYLGPKKNIVVYSDKHKSYVKYYKKRNILNGVFKSSEHISKTNKEVHNQTINYYSGALGKFINEDLRGVSTKYLQGYLNWFMFVQNSKNKNVQPLSVVVRNKQALNIYKQKEKEFQYLLKVNGRTNYGQYKEKYVLDKAA